MTREEEQKARRKSYRDAAQRLINDTLPPSGVTLTVDKNAHVHPTNGGAYVEVQLWVSDAQTFKG